MIRGLKISDRRRFASLSAVCRCFIHAKAGLADAVWGKATACLDKAGNPQAQRHDAAVFGPSFGRAGRPAATRWVDGR
jgi:hypothetical protein